MRKLLISLALALCLMPAAASAATLSLQQAGNVVRVTMDTEGQVINAVEGTIRVEGAGVMPREVSFGQSVVTFWAERPDAGELRFAGIIPGGYEGASGHLFSFELAGSAGAVATVSPQGIAMLLNDGAGTAATVSAPARSMTVAAGSGLAPRDEELPEFVEVVIAQAPSIFDGDWFVAFNAQDAGSGVVRFEVAEARPGTRESALAWQEASSPYRLTDQERGSVVWIRATDAAGNEAVTSVQPADSPDTLRYAAIGVVLLLLLGCAVWTVIRKTRMRR